MVKVHQQEVKFSPQVAGAMIRERRLALGLTPMELAEEIGKSVLSLSRMEHEGLELDLPTVEKCARVLKTDCASLLEYQRQGNDSPAN